jgi:menaquinone-dependent protoporphyrinogen oxidase
MSCASPPRSLQLSPLSVIEMAILVAYANKDRATGEIAERIAQRLRAAGQHADARPVQEAGDLADHEGFVIGSAAYSTHWLKDATAFVRRNRDLLAQRPVWLFSSGPLGAEATEAKGVNLTAARQEASRSRDHRVFVGALDPGRLRFTEWSCLKRPATRAILPEGDDSHAEEGGWA